MKSLSHISVVGLKNHSRTSIEIPRLLAISGDNGAGKSSLLQAIRIGVLGYDPPIGKTLAATRQLVQVGRDRADVTLTFDDGFSIERRIGKSLETRVLPPKGERIDKEIEARIEVETGKFLVAFDLSAFLSLSREKRREWMLHTLPRQSVDLDQGVWRHWLGFEGAEDFIRVAIDKLWTDKVLADQSLLDGLASALAHTQERVNQADAARREQINVKDAAETDAIAASRMPQPDAKRLPALQLELDAVQRKIGEADERRAECERAAEAVRRREHDLVAAKSQLDRAESATRRLEDARAAAPVPEDDVAALMEDLDRAERKARAQRDAVQYAGNKVAEIGGSIKAVRDRIERLGTGDQCPACGATAQLQDLRPALQAELVALQEKLGSAETNAREVQNQQRTYDEAVATTKIRIRMTEERMRQIDSIDAEIRIATSQRDHARAALAKVEVAGAIPEEPKDAGRVELVTRAGVLRSDIAAGQAALREAGKGDAARERADKERGELEVRTKRWEALKGLYVAQQKLRAHVIEQLVGPVEATANEILQAIDLEKQFKFVFEREGRLEFDFGFIEDDVFRSYDAASTGEDAFLAVVLVAALIAAVKPAWSVLMVDNAESIDDVRRRDLMDALEKFADRFGNIIIAGCCGYDCSDAWTQLEMTEGVALRRVAA